MLDLVDVSAKSVIMAIVALLSRFLLLSQLESKTVQFLINDLASLDLVFFSALAVIVQLELETSLALFDVCLAPFVQHSTVVHLGGRLDLDFL